MSLRVEVRHPDAKVIFPAKSQAFEVLSAKRWNELNTDENKIIFPIFLHYDTLQKFVQLHMHAVMCQTIYFPQVVCGFGVLTQQSTK